MIGLIFCLQILLVFANKRYDPDVCSQNGELLYHLLGCTPVKDQLTDPCASRFDCTETRTEPAGCLSSRMGAETTSRRSNNSCTGVCECVEETLLTGPLFKCPEFNGKYWPPGCYYGYDIDGWCSTGLICLPKKIENMHVCAVDGYAYKEGHKFYPSGSCKVCVCHKDFKGKYIEPFCNFPACQIRNQYTSQLKMKCAPVYKDEKALCCPYTWLCPNTIPLLWKDTCNAYGKKCVFGNYQASGVMFCTTLVRQKERLRVECTCQLPPLYTCRITHTEKIYERQ